MSFSKVHSIQNLFLDAELIDVEVDISRGLHSFTIVGLGDKAIDEARLRVSSAIKNCGFKSPKQKNEKIIVSLAPANLRKNGPIFDVAIALSYLKASKEIEFESDKKIFIGELTLDGNLRSINGVLPLIIKAKQLGFEEVFLPKENTKEAAVIGGIKIFGAIKLQEIIDHLDTSKNFSIKESPNTKIEDCENFNLIDFSEIKDQAQAKRGLLIAACGGHNIAMYGPPGTGKTMLAKAFSGILPILDFEDILEVTSIHSVAGINNKIINKAPFRSPHHTSSYISIFGGGKNIKPGEITLAHKGVLFLDEFPEFEKRIIEGLRQPLEDKVISISRSSGSVKYPADFIFIATMNPCPCGYLGSNTKDCECSNNQIQKYKNKISGPIVDRVDIWIEVGQITHKKLLDKNTKHNESKDLQSLVRNIRNIQKERFKKLNSQLSNKDIESVIENKDSIKKILETAGKNLNLSARGLYKVIKVARTIADLDGKKDVTDEHILEALQYRPKN